jgi:hypothetical protein
LATAVLIILKKAIKIVNIIENWFKFHFFQIY